MRGSICGFCKRLLTLAFLCAVIFKFLSIDSYAEASNININTFIENESVSDPLVPMEPWNKKSKEYFRERTFKGYFKEDLSHEIYEDSAPDAFKETIEYGETPYSETDGSLESKFDIDADFYSDFILSELNLLEDKVSYAAEKAYAYANAETMTVAALLSLLLTLSGLFFAWFTGRDTLLTAKKECTRETVSGETANKEAAKTTKNHPSLIAPLKFFKGSYPYIINELNNTRGLDFVNGIEAFLSVCKKERWIKNKQTIY